ncbi:MAG TPA: hypothetical protein VHP83_20365 [Aggregatilineaceae bacterium]|nr:hypothetical protein [Aggregatilineaceae bacterium]
MASNTPEVVQAYTLVKAGKCKQAAEILEPYLLTNQEDVNGWWVMAHAVQDPNLQITCLENVLTLDPRHERARRKLEKLQSAPAEKTFSWDSVLDGQTGPDDLKAKASTQSTFDPMANYGSGADNPFSNVANNDVFPPRTKGELIAAETRGNGKLVNVALGVVGLLLIGAFVLLAVQQGWLDVDKIKDILPSDNGPSQPGVIDGGTYTIDVDDSWTVVCEDNYDAKTCTFASEEQYSIHDDFGGGELVGDSLLNTFYKRVFKDGQQPEMVVTGVVGDYPTDISFYESIRGYIYQMEALYTQWPGTTNYIKGNDYWLKYDKENPYYGNLQGYIYKITGVDLLRDELPQPGYFVVWDIYIPHDNRILVMSIFAYATDGHFKIPTNQIHQMILGVKFN